MQITTGTDIIEIERIKESIETLGERFLKRVFTVNEIAYCESKKKVKYQHYAARFAAKEAVFKAISILLDNKYEINWQNIEIINDESGRPKINFIGIQIKELTGLDISLSHCQQYATATVVAYSER